jgi:hypothetical protein
LTFFSQPSTLFPTTSWPILCHCVLLLLDNSCGHTCNNWIPHLLHSPIMHLLLWNSMISSLEQSIEVHCEVNVLYGHWWAIEECSLNTQFNSSLYTFSQEQTHWPWMTYSSHSVQAKSKLIEFSMVLIGASVPLF